MLDLTEDNAGDGEELICAGVFVEDSDEESERPPTPPPVEKPKKKILKKKA